MPDLRNDVSRATQVSRYVREVYPDTYLAHGQWCGPEWEAAEDLAAKMTDTREKLMEAAGIDWSGRPVGDIAERNRIVASIRKALRKMAAAAK